jgi:hypothetical protein
MGALEAAAAGRVDERRPLPSVQTSVATAAAAPAPAPSPKAVVAEFYDEPRPSRRRLWAMVAGVVVLLIAAGAGYAELSRSGASGGTGILPTPGGSPSPTVIRSITVNPPSPLKMGSPITVSGRGLDPHREAAAGVLQANAVHPIGASLQVQENGTFTIDGIVPNDLASGPAAVVACNLNANHQSDLSQCIQRNVTVTR